MPIDPRPKEKAETKCEPDEESLELLYLVNDIVDGVLYGLAGGFMFLLFTLLAPLSDLDGEEVTLLRILALMFMVFGYYILRGTHPR